jgi:hypothetical protein
MVNNMIHNFPLPRFVALVLLFAVVGFYLFTPRSHAVTGFTRTYDGGMAFGIQQVCTCSASTLLMFRSYVDQTTHQYVYQPGLTQLFANYYGIFKSGGYFLSTHFPVGICLVVSGTTCTTTGLPEGTLLMVGSS